MAEDTQQDQQQADAQPIFGIEKIYVKDISLETPNSPQIFLQSETPQINIDIHHSASMLDAGVFEAVVTVTVTAKIEDKTAFLVEVAQAGIFRIQNVEQESLEPVLAITCPNILYPYVREVISDMVNRAGFPPVLLSPVNFEGLYLQQKQQQQGAPSSEEAPTTH
jgi:preprotein translocase subunit SecB